MSARDQAYVQDLADGLATLVEQAGDTAAEPARRDDHVQLSLWFAGMTRAPASARAALTELDPTVDPDRLQALQLVVTELVTNSLRHAGIGERDVIGVDVRVSDGVLRCTVSDPGRGFDKPDVVKPHTDRAGGFGLVILESVAESWELIRDGLFGVRFDMRL